MSLLAGMLASLTPQAPGTVTLNSTYNPVAMGAGLQIASFSLESDGDVVENAVDTGDWLSPKSAAPSLYEVRASIVSGTVTTGTTGSWLALTSNQTWTKNDAANDGITEICELTIEIRYNGGSVLATSTVTLEANSTG